MTYTKLNGRAKNVYCIVTKLAKGTLFDFLNLTGGFNEKLARSYF